MTPRILLIGKNGQIGSALAPLLAPLGELTALGRSDLDLANPDDIRRAISSLRPLIIVNAAAYTAVDRAEAEEPLARTINADAPTVIAEEARKIGAFLVHYSTDYVFDGRSRSPYTESDSTNPVNAYGRTKLAGEEAIRNAQVPHLILRTAWVYATSGKNFLLTILRLAAERDELRIVNDQFGAPTWSREIAAGTARVLNPFCASESALQEFAALSGTYHLTAAGQTSWYDFALAFLDESSHLSHQPPWLTAITAGRPIRAKIVPIPTADYPTPALRPAYSVLSNVRFASTFGFALPDWRAQLASAFRS
ncbi:MAG TPA: dTDP-4-dehydrorhamnose reductase [Candidatus Limnocylindrales bacterium]|nr:dTDP-4-dehydrorhamnose reductase [Candidatus Limnocylindrales bacterium]